jgi:hypothetical protein
MMTLLLIAVVAILEFLCFTGGAIGPRVVTESCARRQHSQGEQVFEQSVLDRIGSASRCRLREPTLRR